MKYYNTKVVIAGAIITACAIALIVYAFVGGYALISCSLLLIVSFLALIVQHARNTVLTHQNKELLNLVTSTIKDLGEANAHIKMLKDIIETLEGRNEGETRV